MIQGESVRLTTREMLRRLGAGEAIDSLCHVAGISREDFNSWRQAIEHLRMWDCRMETDRVGASIFESFFTQWSQAIANERFTREVSALVSGAIGGLASELLAKDTVGWFQKVSRQRAILRVLDAALDDLARRLGPDMSQWSWGNLHKINLKHILSGRGELSLLLDRGGAPVRGNGSYCLQHRP
jgi:penicillin amidase